MSLGAKGLRLYFATVAVFNETRQERAVFRQNTVLIATPSSKAISHYKYTQYAFERQLSIPTLPLTLSLSLCIIFLGSINRILNRCQ